jgi:hypothetical protein
MAGSMNAAQTTALGPRDAMRTGLGTVKADVCAVHPLEPLQKQVRVPALLPVLSSVPSAAFRSARVSCTCVFVCKACTLLFYTHIVSIFCRS